MGRTFNEYFQIMSCTFSKVINYILLYNYDYKLFIFIYFNLFFLKYNFRNVINKNFSDPIKKKMKSLLKATSKTELDQIFLDIENSEENGTKGIFLLKKFAF